MQLRILLLPQPFLPPSYGCFQRCAFSRAAILISPNIIHSLTSYHHPLLGFLCLQSYTVCNLQHQPKRRDKTHLMRWNPEGRKGKAKKTRQTSTSNLWPPQLFHGYARIKFQFYILLSIWWVHRNSVCMFYYLFTTSPDPAAGPPCRCPICCTYCLVLIFSIEAFIVPTIGLILPHTSSVHRKSVYYFNDTLQQPRVGQGRQQLTRPLLTLYGLRSQWATRHGLFKYERIGTEQF